MSNIVGNYYVDAFKTAAENNQTEEIVIRQDPR